MQVVNYILDIFMIKKKAMKYILVIDEGTSHTRAILFDLNGNIYKINEYELTQYFPKPGWVEHCAEEIWQHTKMAIQAVCSDIDVSDIVSCGLTNQRETCLLWNKKTGKPLSKAIVWQDRRTQDICNQLKFAEDDVFQRTGLKLDPYFSASKLKWLIDYHQLSNIDDIAFGTIDSYLIFCMTGGRIHATDITNASRTLLFNIHDKQWDSSLLKLFSIPQNLLPQVLDCDADYGYLTKDIIGRKIPIRGVIGDQQASIVGVGAMSNGQAKVTYGTGGFVMCNTGKKPYIQSSGLLATIAYQLKGQCFYALEGNIYDAGANLSWLKNNLGLIEHYADAEKLAASVDSTNGVYFIPAFSGLGAPHWITSCGASFVGMSRGTHKAHLVRAILESIAYQTRDILAAMQQFTNQKLVNLSVDGGVANNQWFLNYLATLNQIQIEVPHTFENTAKGAAWVAGTAMNAVDDIQTWQKHANISFQPPNLSIEESYRGWLDMIKSLV